MPLEYALPVSAADRTSFSAKLLDHRTRIRSASLGLSLPAAPTSACAGTPGYAANPRGATASSTVSALSRELLEPRAGPAWIAPHSVS